MFVTPVTVAAEATLGRVISVLARGPVRLGAARDRLASEIEAVFERHPQAPVLLSIPGNGALTGSTTRQHVQAVVKASG